MTKRKTRGKPRKTPESTRKTSRRNKSMADETNSYFDKSLIVAEKVYEMRLKANKNKLAPMDGIHYYLKKSNEALNKNDVQRLMMYIAFLSVYAGTYNAKSSVNVSTLKFPGVDPNYMIEYKTLDDDDEVEFTREMKRYEDRINKKKKIKR